MKTNQRFIIEMKNGSEKYFLLMPDEVKEFHEIKSRVSAEYSFQRLTGQNMSEIKSFKLELFEIYEA